MTTVKNISDGPRVINATPPVALQPGDEVEGLTISDVELSIASKTGWFEIDGKTDPLDHDGDGKKGGAKFPGLTGKTKAELLDIAAAEDVTDVSDADTVEDIKTAIELSRADKAQA